MPRAKHPRIRKLSRREHIQQIIRKWEAEHPGETIDFEVVAAEAIRTRAWSPRPRSAIRQCARELASAARQDFFPNDTNEPVRRYHAAPYRKGDRILYLWEPIDKASETHMRRSAQSRRNGVEADLMQLKRDVSWWNKNNGEGKVIQLDLNFERDAEERDMPTEYPDAPE